MTTFRLKVHLIPDRGFRSQCFLGHRSPRAFSQANEGATLPFQATQALSGNMTRVDRKNR